MAATDLSQTITDAAGNPASTAADGTSATAVPIPELIAADQYTAAKAAIAGTNPQGGARSGWALLRPAKVIPPGAV